MDGAAIFYFSGTGNTRFCALALAQELASRGLPARVLSIEAPGASAALRALGPGILPVFAYPIYGSDLPLPMRDFLRLLPLRGADSTLGLRDAAVFCTQLAFSGDGAALADEELLPRGFRARWTAHINMPNNVTIRGFPFPWTNDPERLERSRNKAVARLAAFAAAIIQGKAYRQGRGPISLPLGLIQRLPFRAVVEKHRNRVGVDSSRCTRCGLCVRLCPLGNLSLGRAGLEAAGRCVLCLRCYNFCPQMAISFYGQAPDPHGKTPYRGPEPGFDPLVLREEAREIISAPRVYEPQGPKSGWEEQARQIVEMDSLQLVPYLDELMVWLQDINWPGSPLIADKLCAMGDVTVPAVEKVLNSTDLVCISWVLDRIVAKWPPELVAMVRDQLEILSQRKDAEGNYEIAKRILG